MTGEEAFDEPTRNRLAELRKKPIDIFGERIGGQNNHRGVRRVLKTRNPERCAYPERDRVLREVRSET